MINFYQVFDGLLVRVAELFLPKPVLEELIYC
jgi:hypothetical protein